MIYDALQVAASWFGTHSSRRLGRVVEFGWKRRTVFGNHLLHFEQHMLAFNWHQVFDGFSIHAQEIDSKLLRKHVTEFSS